MTVTFSPRKFCQQHRLRRGKCIALNATFTLGLILSCCRICHSDQYLTKDEALNLVFGNNCEQHYQPKKIPPQLITKLQDAHVWREPKEEAYFFSCSVADHVQGYALIDSEVGKHLPITYIVGISPEGTVTRVEIMVFRETRGSEAKDHNFMKQFKGKTAEDSLTVGKELRNVTGATLSSQAIATGVKRALLMWHFFYKETQHN